MEIEAHKAIGRLLDGFGLNKNLQIAKMKIRVLDR